MPPGFTHGWFDELRALDSATVAHVPPLPGNYRPTINQFGIAGMVSHAFVETAEHVQRILYQTPYRFEAPFRVWERHLANFPAGRAFRKQWNIAFTAGTDSDDDCARIGIGFRLSRGQCHEGVDDYTDFVMAVGQRPQDFDITFAALGNYAEMPDALVVAPLSGQILNDPQLDLDDDWRFFGKCLNRAAAGAVLDDVDLFVQEAINVFTAISHAGFY